MVVWFVLDVVVLVDVVCLLASRRGCPKIIFFDHGVRIFFFHVQYVKVGGCFMVLFLIVLPSTVKNLKKYGLGCWKKKYPVKWTTKNTNNIEHDGETKSSGFCCHFVRYGTSIIRSGTLCSTYRYSTVWIPVLHLLKFIATDDYYFLLPPDPICHGPFLCPTQPWTQPPQYHIIFPKLIAARNNSSIFICKDQNIRYPPDDRARRSKFTQSNNSKGVILTNKGKISAFCSQQPASSKHDSKLFVSMISIRNWWRQKLLRWAFDSTDDSN